MEGNLLEIVKTRLFGVSRRQHLINVDSAERSFAIAQGAVRMQITQPNLSALGEALGHTVHAYTEKVRM